MTDKEFYDTLQEIIIALKAKGYYSPYEQILGYLKTGVDTYITRHNDARNKIKSLDKIKLKEYIENNTIS